jgi:FAD/FMN-containing dehydrogenase/Fe-S oxidoreductase
MSIVIRNHAGKTSLHNGVVPAPGVDARSLEAELRETVRGEVRFDQGSRALYATDASIYRQTPIGVVIPQDMESVIQTIALARRYGAPILARGCGTSLEGQCCNTAIVIDFSKYLNNILQIDPVRKLARVQPGVICDQLRNAAEHYHLTFGPDPATHNHCTLGGMIGNNACGVHSVMAGKTVDNIEDMEILTYDGLRLRAGPTSDTELEQIIREGGRRGQIYADLLALRDHYAELIRARYPRIPRRISGYNLDELLPENGFNVARALVGTENTCVTVLEATTRLVDSPQVRSLLVLGYEDAYTAGDHVMEIMEHQPIGLEGFDGVLIEDLKRKQLHASNIRLLPEGGGWLLVDFGGNSKDEVDEKAHRLMAQLKKQRKAPTMRLFEDPHEQKLIWEIRENGVGGASAVPDQPFTWPNWEDSAVPPEKLGSYLRDLRDLFHQYGYVGAFFGHFGQGCIHTRISFDLRDAEGIKTFRSFMYAAADLVVSYGGSLSGEHGDGQGHAELLPRMFGHELVEAFARFKTIWDPEGKMNPGKVVNAYRMDQNLRLGASFESPRTETHFQFPDDRGSFTHAALRCIGIGKCRRIEHETMCPSFMVTREEKHSTRGRARLLFEMLEGRTLEDGWRDEHVKEALDLCLSCKGCKGDCPVRVDMATYKAEFLAHYYAGRLRPASAYALGLIDRWARLASRSPGLVNLVTQTPGLRRLAKAAAGIAPERELPPFARQSFQQWFRQRGPRNIGHERVILWPDTFNNYFHPETAQAAVEVLEAAGYQVEVPEAALCCGRPLYDYGMLDQAKHYLQRILQTLRPQIRAGTPIVALEPSCAAVFRDELHNLFPEDDDAKRLNRQVLLLSEFLQKHANSYELPRLPLKAVVHGHCHHKAIMGMEDEAAVLNRLGLEVEMLDAGCCGMAGSFGFEKGEHYDVSIRAGERVLLPAVRETPKDALIITDGFSCREQIAQGSDRQALHLAQVLQMALREGEHTSKDAYPERRYSAPARAAAAASRKRAMLVGSSALLLGGGVIYWGLKQRVRGDNDSRLIGRWQQRVKTLVAETVKKAKR